MGLYSRKSLPAFTVFGPYTGARVASIQANDHYSFSLGDKKSVDAGKSGNQTRFINDYRGTGSRRNADSVLADDNVFFYLTEPVGEGEEILLDYGDTYWKYYNLERD